MGVIICRKHGRQGFDEVCGHLHELYERGLYSPGRKFRLGGVYVIRVCDQCWARHDLDRFERFSAMDVDEFLDLSDEEIEPIEKEWQKVYEAVGRRLWCLRCLTEIQVSRAGEKAPSNDF